MRSAHQRLPETLVIVALTTLTLARCAKAVITVVTTLMHVLAVLKDIVIAPLAGKEIIVTPALQNILAVAVLPVLIASRNTQAAVTMVWRAQAAIVS